MPCVTSSVWPSISMTVGVPHDGISSRLVRHACLPVCTSNAATNEFCWMSHWTMTRFFQMIGELAAPHS